MVADASAAGATAALQPRPHDCKFNGHNYERSNEVDAKCAKCRYCPEYYHHEWYYGHCVHCNIHCCGDDCEFGCPCIRTPDTKGDPHEMVQEEKKNADAKSAFYEYESTKL